MRDAADYAAVRWPLPIVLAIGGAWLLAGCAVAAARRALSTIPRPPW